MSENSFSGLGRSVLALAALTAAATAAAVSPTASGGDGPVGADRRIALRTNAAGWGLMMINAAVEFDVARQWSVAVPVYYSGFNYFHSNLKFRTLTCLPECRFWIDDCRSGGYLAARCGFSFYNVALGGRYRYQDRDGRNPAIGGGLGIGWRWRFPDNRHWFVDAAIGGGVYAVTYDRYENRPGGRLVSSHGWRAVGCIDNVELAIGYSF